MALISATHTPESETVSGREERQRVEMYQQQKQTKTSKFYTKEKQLAVAIGHEKKETAPNFKGQFPFLFGITSLIQTGL